MARSRNSWRRACVVVVLACAGATGARAEDETDAVPDAPEPSPAPLYAGPADATGPRAYDSPYPQLKVFADVLAALKNQYVDPVEDKKLVYAAIRGMLSTLDPHTTFYDPQEAAGVLEDTSGESGTIGLLLEQVDQEIVVRGTFDDTPAARVGLAARDRLTAIDGQPTRGVPLGEVERRLRGPPGTLVTLEIMRSGFEKPRALPPIRREVVRVKVVEGELRKGDDGDVAIIRIRAFQDRTDADFKAELVRLKDLAGPRFKGLVIDLRGNPGGLLQEAVNVAERFLAAKQVIVTSQGFRKPRSTYAAHGGTSLESGYPVVVVVDGGTASASEVLSAALQENNRALVVGTTTFGKGTVQQILPLDDGSKLKVTVARYYTPSGASLQEQGIVPDIVAPLGAADGRVREANLPGHIVHEGAAPPVRVSVPWTQLADVKDEKNAPPDVALQVAIVAVRGHARTQELLTLARARMTGGGQR